MKAEIERVLTDTLVVGIEFPNGVPDDEDLPFSMVLHKDKAAAEIEKLCESKVAEAQEQYGKSEEVVLLQAKQLSEAHERLADATITIGVLKATIKTREDMDEQLREQVNEERSLGRAFRLKMRATQGKNKRLRKKNEELKAEMADLRTEYEIDEEE